MPIPAIETPRLILRAFTEQDIDPLHRILSEPEALRYFPQTEPPSREQVERLIARQLEHWEKYNYGWWAVTLPTDQELMGWCGLQFLPETDETEVGYLLGKTHWGQGFATEAAKASLQFGFGTLGFQTIVAIVHPENKASIRVIEKLGMSLVDRTVYFGMEVFRYSTTR